MSGIERKQNESDLQGSRSSAMLDYKKVLCSYLYYVI